MSNATFPGLFAPAEDTVVEAASCTYCGAEVGQDCALRDRKAHRAHMARWFDFWNATHDRSEQHPVHAAQWRSA